MARKRKVGMIEYTDEITGKVYTCPDRFLAIKPLLKCGAANAQTAEVLLKVLNEAVSKGNERHVRKASYILRAQGLLVGSLRSSKGGYFIAETEQEVKYFTEPQRKFAKSMLRSADRMEEIFREQQAEKAQENQLSAQS